jgi:hypothetical protein
MMTLISLGAGVQSSTMALMAKHGEITPMPDGAIFADTGAEPQGVYDWLDWLEQQLPFPVHRVMKNNGLRQPLIDGHQDGKRYATPPFYADSDKGGILLRQCTREYKVEPITRKVRELVGLAKGERAPKEILAEQWIGISLDEIQRMKHPQQHWLCHRWPLIEMRMTRGHCLEWMAAHSYPQPPRSACTFCPYHSNHEWRQMIENDPESWADAVAMDALIRDGVRGTTERLYVHRSMVPLAEADLTDKHENQRAFSFMDECEGMCGI